MTNIYEINDLVDFLTESGMNTKQFTYCLLLYYDKKYSRIEGTAKLSRPLSQLYKYFTNVEEFTKAEIQQLIDSGYLNQTGHDFKPDHLETTDKFERNWFGEPTYKLDQLIEVYPKHVDNFDHPGKGKIPLIIMSNYAQVEKTYNRFVSTYKMHNRVLAVTQWAKQRNMIKMGIEKYINSKHWEYLLEQKNSDETMQNYTHMDI